jgi:hypothetical protein
VFWHIPEWGWLDIKKRELHFFIVSQECPYINEQCDTIHSMKVNRREHGAGCEIFPARHSKVY